LKTAMTSAALDGRETLETHDILAAAELALAHRIKRHALEGPAAGLDGLAEKLGEARRTPPAETQAQAASPEAAESSEEKKTKRERS